MMKMVKLVNAKNKVVVHEKIESRQRVIEVNKKMWGVVLMWMALRMNHFVVNWLFEGFYK